MRPPHPNIPPRPIQVISANNCGRCKWGRLASDGNPLLECHERVHLVPFAGPQGLQIMTAYARVRPEQDCSYWKPRIDVGGASEQIPQGTG